MKIYFLNGVHKDAEFELEGDEIGLGREVDNDIIVETDGVSRYHAKLFRQIDGSWLLEDMDSTNGCKVNNKLIDDEKLLKEGDLINIGEQDLRFGEAKAKKKSKAKTGEAPIIKTVKESTKKPIIEKASADSSATPTVKKIVFQPMPKKTKKSPAPEKKGKEPQAILETVKPKAAEEKPKAVLAKKPEITAKELSENVSNIFGEQNNDSNSEKKKLTTESARKHVFNVLFYLMLLLVVVVFVIWFLNSNKEVKKQNIASTARSKKIPLVLYYVKTKITKGNVFRFSLLVENNIAKFTIDDLISDRHHSKTIKDIKPEFMKALKSAIEDTGFMGLAPVSRGSAVNNLDKTRKMTIALDKKYNSIIIQNNSAPTSFEDIEMAINDFAEAYNLLTFAMPPKELQKRAEESFVKAEEYYDNRKANSGNLLEAERRYKLTVDYLSQFSPKPKIWDIARKRYSEVRSTRMKRWKELKYEVDRLGRLGKLQKAIETLNEMLLLAYEDDKAKKWARKKISKYSRTLNARKK